MRKTCLNAFAAFCLAATLLAPSAKADATMPSEDVRDMLITITLLRFNDANQTKDYGVFRALASQEFRKLYSESELAKGSATFQDRRFRLDEVAIREIHPAEDGEMIHDGTLRLKGHLDLSQFRLNYLLRFVEEQGDWKLTHISVTTDTTP